MSEEEIRKQFKNRVNALNISKIDKKILIDFYMERCNVIDKAREYIKNGLDFKSLHFIKGQDEDMWKIILIDNIKQDLLRILGDKE